MEALPQRWVAGILGALSALLLVRLLGMAWLMAVDVPFSDQWAILRALDDGFQWADVWHAFWWQHGPHRQGLSFALILPLYHFSDWSVRLDSMVVALTQLLAGGLALRLRRQLVPGPWSLWDGLMLLVVWGVSTFETMVVSTNASHSVFPLLLLLLLANVWLWREGLARVGCLALLILFLSFTGFGITALPVLVLVLAIGVWRREGDARTHAAVLLLACLGSLVLFLQGHVFEVAADGFQTMRPNPVDYLHFVLEMFSHFLVMVHRISRWLSYPIGIAVLAGCVWVAWLSVRRLAAASPSLPQQLEENRFSEVVLILIGCSLTFALLTAYGRVQLGLYAAAASRYSALLMPALLGLVIALMRYRAAHKAVWWALLALSLLFVLRVVPETRAAYLQTRYYTAMKLCWLEQYRQTKDFDATNQQVAALDGHKTFSPAWMGSEGYWQYLQEIQVGPFAAGATSAPFLAVFPEPCEVLKAP